MFEVPDNPYLVPFDGSFQVNDLATQPPRTAPDEKERRKKLAKATDKLAKWQRKLYADDRFSLLLVFQAMDAAGKDSTIRAVMSGVNPAGCQVFSFKRPSKQELDHDFLWRSANRLPERGRIGVFNRSYYEEVLVVRVHPGILENQRLPEPAGADFWQQRYQSINDHERHLAQNGVIILKFWLNVSKEEQRQRFLARIDDPDKNWKFNAGDVAERAHWSEYQNAYQDALNATSKPWAPWYAIPADEKGYMRWQVADIINQACANLPVDYPELADEATAGLATMRELLMNEGAD
jgi:PPK2 family polyphosphate:nucleotide phosphotransferase